MTGLRVTLNKLDADLTASLQALRHDPSRVVASRQRVEKVLNDGVAHYGINTGFGALAQKHISTEQLSQLQKNLLLSHAVGVGPPVSPAITALMLKLKTHALGLGYSGISQTTFSRLLDFVERGLIPVVPTRGSVGASGDLAPLAHLALPLIGQGSFWDQSGQHQIPAAQALRQHKLEPIELGPKDGLALINGTQFMTAYGAFVLANAQRVVRLFDVAAALSLEALQGSSKPFDPRVQTVRPHPGQATVATNIRALLTDSEILESHRNCNKVQDPYSLRCVPQVHGASRDALAHCSRVVETEINSVSDNPLVFDNGDIISCGNFHGQPLALALDFAAMALAELASISERRIYLLLEGHDGLPKLLMRETGINSGFMIPQYTAAALVSENKVLCHPACVDSIPTSLGQEDHVSMGSISAVKLLQVFENIEHVLAIEFVTAAQAIDYRAPLKPGRGILEAHRVIREHIPHHEQDFCFHDDLRQILELNRRPTILDRIEASGIELA